MHTYKVQKTECTEVKQKANAPLEKNAGSQEGIYYESIL